MSLSRTVSDVTQNTVDLLRLRWEIFRSKGFWTHGVVGIGVGGVMVMLTSVIVMVLMGDGNTIRLAGPRAFPLAERAALRQPLHVVMVAFLSSANVLLEAQHLGPVFAEGAIHGCVAPEHLLHPLLESVHHQRVLPQIAGGEDVNLGMIRRHPLGVLTDAAHQNT